MCSWDKIEEWNFDILSACQYRNGVRSPIKVWKFFLWQGKEIRLEVLQECAVCNVRLSSERKSIDLWASQFTANVAVLTMKKGANN